MPVEVIYSRVQYTEYLESYMPTDTEERPEHFKQSGNLLAENSNHKCLLEHQIVPNDAAHDAILDSWWVAFDLNA